MRRMRRDAFSRALVREHSLATTDLIYPVLVCVVSFFSPGVFAFVEMSGIYPSESS